MQLVLEVEHVVSLLVPECFILVLSQHIDEGVMLLLLGLFFDLSVLVDLRYGIVLRFSFLDIFVLNLDVWIWLSLELLLMVDVGADLLFPVAVLFVSGEEHFVARCLSDLLVCARDGHFLIEWKLYKF